MYIFSQDKKRVVDFAKCTHAYIKAIQDKYQIVLVLVNGQELEMGSFEDEKKAKARLEYIAKSKAINGEFLHFI